jgi:DNA (cytosine-5)-methyltransferase 1
VALDFFAGSGLVTAGLKPYFQVAWANDICEKKAAVYLANHPGDGFVVAPIEQIRGAVLPAATLSWGSFPCQDLSLAGNLQGIQSSRSGLVWHWLRVMDEMCATPPLVVAENVVGLVSADNGEHYRQLHQSLVARGYRVGAVVVDAAYWIPQSRPRIFVIGVNDQVDISEFEDDMPGWAHPAPLQRAARGLEGWVWWRLPAPRSARKPLEDLIDFAADCDGAEKREHNLKLINPQHRQKMQRYAEAGFRVFPGYKRTRNGRQVLELRFDGLAGCLRTPEGGSSRQLLVLWREGKFETRLLTIREVALLMGAKSSYQLPGSYNEAYKAMGDAVAVPVVSHLSRHILAPIAAKLTCD